MLSESEAESEYEDCLQQEGETSLVDQASNSPFIDDEEEDDNESNSTPTPTPTLPTPSFIANAAEADGGEEEAGVATSAVSEYGHQMMSAVGSATLASLYYLHDYCKNIPPNLLLMTDYISRGDRSFLMEKKEILCVSFNQDCSCLAVGHEDGYSFYSLRSIDRLEKLTESRNPERACIVERLYLSSLITVVSMKSTRKLQVYHSIKENEICSHTYASAILAVRMNRKRVVVCLEDSINIHNVRDMRLLHMIKDTPLNPQGIMDLSNDESSCYLAFPGSSTTGHVMVFDTDALVALCSFSAHAGALAALKFNPDGTKLATASDKGTVIRVFGIPTGDRLFEFTRGVKRCVTINSLAFNADSKYLCLSSNTETVHVFSLQKPQEQMTNEAAAHHHHHHQEEAPSQEGLGAWVNWASQQASAYFPTHMNELMLREKSIATARLPISDTKTVVAMPRINNVDYLLVASMDGYLFCYTLDTDGSGECTLMRQYRVGPKHASESEEDVATGIPISTGGGGGGVAVGSPSGGGSSSSLSSTHNSSSNKPQPPPIPPAPKKRNTPPPASTPHKPPSASTNPFEMDESNSGGGRGGGTNNKSQHQQQQRKTSDDLSGSGGGGAIVDLSPPADLNDMDEFPPLTHATL